MATAIAHIDPAARYGRNNDLANEAWNHQQDNDQQQKNSASNAGYAQGAAQTGAGFTGGAENGGLANTEANSRYGAQSGAIGLAGTMARGNTPSQAAYQLQSGLDQGSAQQAAMARGARGSAALATADANANANVSNMQQNAFSQAGILRANEMAAGRGLYGSLSGQQRDQDQQRLQQANDMAQFNAQQHDKYTVGMAGMATGYGQLNNQQEQGDQAWNDIGMHAVDAQGGMDQERQGWLQQARSSIDAMNKENQ